MSKKNLESTAELELIDKKVKSYRMKKNTVKTVLAVLLLLALIYVIYDFVTLKYTDFKVLSTVDKEVGSNTKSVRYRDGFIKYDNDGIAYYTGNNKVVWQQSYEFRNPIISVCGDYAAVSGLEKSEVILFGAKGKIITLNTVLPVTEIDVTGNGFVAVTLVEEQNSYVRMYDSAGNMVYDLKKVLAGTGYPLTSAVSPDGKRLVMSVIYIKDNKSHNKLMCYNFSGVGQNEVDNFVGEFECDGIVSELKFFKNNRFMAIGTKTMKTYSFDEYPKQLKSTEFKYEIERLFVEGERVATLHTEEGKQILEVYNSACKRVLGKTLDRTYENVALSDKGVFLYNHDHACLINKYGRVRFEYDFDVPLNSILWMPGNNRFVFVNVRSIQQVVLTR